MSLFGFLTKNVTLADSHVCKGMVDCHSHIIPGVDDGIQKIEDSLAVLDLYEKLGMKELYCTPHIMEDFPNSTQKLKDHFDQLCDAYKGGIKLHLAAEYMIDNLLLQRLSEKDLLPHGVNGDHLLIETSYYSSPGYFDEVVEKVRSMGLWPLLAHPERYNYMEKERYEQLKSQGVKFQMNLPALLGRYGDDVKKKASMLLSKGMYDFIGTDVHRFEPDLGLRKIRKSDVELLKRMR
ncbi:MAG: capsular biosynthesis protein [Paludibacteraceae bacterium]|nr:capsular biosynthesis protein [Paludibacteraceae bacterium]